MKGYPSKQYLERQKSKYKAIKALVQKKHEIRINFSTSNTCIVQKVDLDKEPYGDIFNKEISRSSKRQGIHSNMSVPMKLDLAREKKTQSPQPQDDLYEVLQRQGKNLASIGWSEEVPIKRTSNMSRTFRRRRRSNLQEYSTIDDNFHQIRQDDSSRAMKNSQLTINNLEMSGFTNQEIVKNGGKNIVPLSLPKSKKDGGKYPKILTFIGEKNMKRVEFLPPEVSSSNGVFAIASNKIHKQWKYQTVNVQQSKSLEKSYNPETNEQDRPLTKGQETRQASADKQNSKSILYEHPFLKQIKPSTLVQKRKAITQRRAQSQFIRSRPKAILIENQKICQHHKEEQVYRPWSVFRNMEQKIDEGQSPKQTIVSQNQQ